MSTSRLAPQAAGWFPLPNSSIDLMQTLGSSRDMQILNLCREVFYEVASLQK